MKTKQEKKVRVNEEIRENLINVVVPEKGMLKDIDIHGALDMATEYGLDLVEVSPSNEKSLSICKIMDYGKIKYEQSKKKKGKIQVLKEIKFNLSISDHDLETKHNQMLKFISKGYNIRYMMQIKGREMGRREEALSRFNESLEKFSEVASWEEPRFSGRLISVTLKNS